MTDSRAARRAAQDRCAVVELRQYTLRPGRREIMIDLFERELVEPQEAVGMRLPGRFRDLDDPDRFVWLRGFSDMDSRARALTTFYDGGPVWKAHRDAARATMVNTDDVLLLRPPRPGSGFSLTGPMPPLVTATIYHLAASEDGEFALFFENHVRPVLGSSLLAYFETEPAENTYPALPVRAGENVFVVFSLPGDAERLASDADSDGLTVAVQRLRLETVNL